MYLNSMQYEINVHTIWIKILRKKSLKTKHTKQSKKKKTKINEIF